MESPRCAGLPLGLVCFALAALSGLVGFLIVYHYASYERPTRNFAIVIDAGSTQTRSALFALELDAAGLADQLEASQDSDDSANLDEQDDERRASCRPPLAKLIQVRQVGSCVNGGPLAKLSDEGGAHELLAKCMAKFALQIRRLDYLAEEGAGAGPDDGPVGADEHEDQLRQQLAAMSHRVNSVTSVYMGATAGMRALAQLNASRALEKVNWMERAIELSNYALPRASPFLNKAYVGILEGAEEANFGWLSVNFVCERLRLQPHPRGLQLAGQERAEYATGDAAPPADRPRHAHALQPNSIGTLELGGASAQMAFEAPEGGPADASLSGHSLELFGSKLDLASRSDLCMGMSQATLRLNLLLVRDAWMGANASAPSVELANPCLQRQARLSLGAHELGELARAPCMAASQLDAPDQQFRASLGGRQLVRFVGTGDTQACSRLLDKLVEPSECRRHFALCPPAKNTLAPPAHMPFVTISGYNKALQVLDLAKLQPASPSKAARRLEQSVADRLGGYALNHSQLLARTVEFCRIDVSELPLRYPTMNSNYYAINCLQLVYIEKLLTHFYLFDPQTSWQQVKFLIFPAASEASSGPHVDEPNKNDIGWTLGLLLNSTSAVYASDGLTGDQSRGQIFYHHSSSVAFVLWTTMLLMLACVLIALCALAVGAVLVRRRQRTGDAYISHHC